MMLNRNKKTTFITHLKIFKTYKELKKILPLGFIQTRVSPNHKYSFKNHLLIKLEKEKRPTMISILENNNKNTFYTFYLIVPSTISKITENLLSNKNIYISSEENKTSKKNIYNLKNYYLNKNPKNINAVKSESNIIKKTHKLGCLRNRCNSIGRRYSPNKNEVNRKNVRIIIFIR